MDRCYHLIMSKYSNLLWLIYWHFLPTAAYFLLFLYTFWGESSPLLVSCINSFFQHPTVFFLPAADTAQPYTHHSAGGWEDSFIKCRVYFVIFKFPTHRWEYNPEHNCKYFIYHILTILHKTGQNLYIHFFSYTVQFPLSIWICVSFYFIIKRFVESILSWLTILNY